jgi:7-keto-8-aminopelargonate synthetase-like enzyme
VAAALAALELLREEPQLPAKLRANSAVLRKALRENGFDVRQANNTADDATPIIPIIIGEAQAATQVCEAALGMGVFAQAIRPPTVAPGTSRLRLSLMASHDPDGLRHAARVLATAKAQIIDRASYRTL